jgi:hypothetical protein
MNRHQAHARLSAVTLVAVVGAASTLTGTLAAAGPGGPAVRDGTPPPAASHRHHPSPSHFTRGRVDNPWFPLKPGTVYTYRGSDDGARTTDVLLVTYRTRVVDGVTCRVVFDRVWTNGRLSETTHDWYAQTRAGTVWYFGERTATLDRHGHVTSREGSFTSGVGGAEAGIFMTARPRRGPSYFQEYFPGHAEDVFTVLSRHAHVSVPLLRSANALLTREISALEPGVVDHKLYVRDIGVVSEATVRGGSERLRLVRIAHHPRRPGRRR